MIETVCRYVMNAGTEMSECTCYHTNECEYQNPDYNPDGRINVVTCEKYLPEPPCSSTPCIKCRYYKNRKCWLIEHSDRIQTDAPRTTPPEKEDDNEHTRSD